MGTIYLALDISDDDRPVALKILGERRGDSTVDDASTGRTAAARDETFAEAALLAQLRHPGIVRYIAHGNAPELGDYIAMEWVAGEDLGVCLEERGPLSLEQILRLGLRVAESLAAAHRIGVIHRDIKPANIILADGHPEQAKLVDFGISQVTRRSLYRGGTPGFAAPEQLAGGPSVDARADVFALGRVLIACVLSTALDDGETMVTEVTASDLNPEEQLPTAAQTEPVLELCKLCPDLPAQLEHLLQRMVARDPEQRPANAGMVATQLLEIASVFGPTSAAITTREQQVRVIIVLPRDVELDEGIRDLVRRFDGIIELHGERSTLLSFRPQISEGDLGVRVGRCALELRALLPDVPLSLLVASVDQSPAAFQRELAETTAVAEDASATSRPGIAINRAATPLLGVRFELSSAGRGPLLLREITGARLLLGRACPWIGRAEELSILEERACAARLGPVAVVISGAAGIGKTRLLNQLRLQLQRSAASPQFVRSRADPLTAGYPFALLSALLESAVGTTKSAPTKARQDSLRRTVAMHVDGEDRARVTIFLAELLGAPFDEDCSDALRVARQDPALMAEQSRRAWREFIVAVAGERPLVLCVDDLQWGDLASVRFLDDILDPTLGAAVLVIGSGRPDMHSRFPTLWSQRELTKRSLSGLDEGECRDFVASILGADALPQALAEDLRGRTQGNPLFLEELVRAVAEGSLDRLPTTIQAILRSRLDALDSAARRILRAASVFGQTFWCEAIATLRGEEDDTQGIRDWLDTLVTQELLVRRPRPRLRGATEYEFRNKILADAAYATLTAADVRSGHLAAGRWLCDAGERNPVVLAEHFERGADYESAAVWLALAADQAFERSEFDAVLELTIPATTWAPRGEPRGRLLLRRAEVQAVIGEHAAAMDNAFAALDELPPEHPRWYSAAGEAALASGRAGAPERVAGILDRIGEITATGGGENLMGLVRAALPLATAGATDTAAKLLNKVVRAAAFMADKDPGALGSLHAARALRAIARGSIGIVYQEMEAAADAFEAVGSVRNALEMAGGAGFFALELGCLERGETILRRTIERSREVGLAHLEAVAMHNLGKRIGEAGRVAEGLDLERQACLRFEQHGNLRMEGLTLTHIAWIHLCEGDTDAAVQAIERAVQRLEGIHASQIVALATRAQIQLATGDAPAALRSATAAHDGLVGLQRIQEGESLIRLTWAEALYHNGRHEDAHAALHTALQSVDERARGIARADLRRSFRERLPENARISTLSQEWGLTDSHEPH